MSLKNIIFISTVLAAFPLRAKTFLSFEGDFSWQSRNNVRIPAATGTQFSLTDFSKGPFASGRIYLGHKFSEKHEFRILYAPFKANVAGQFANPVSYQNVNFLAATPTDGLYMFNSYRMTYAYHMEPMGPWNLALGFTLKVRDAAIRLTQGALVAEKSNVGLVPLINFQATRMLSDDLKFRFDVDGSAAPQGRAFDAALFVEYPVAVFGAGHVMSAFAGYRTIEGGADAGEVYNFAWIHKAVLGVRGDF